MKALSPEENDKLKQFKVCVIGCGGLGGHVIEALGRIGIGQITAVDGDVFDESNLNRQLLASEDVIGISKAVTAKARMQKVNSDVSVVAISEYVNENNCEKILKGHDIVIDALDNIQTRILIEKETQRLEIPLVHGAIAGWYGQVSVIMPGKPFYGKIYNENVNKGIETELGNLPFTAAVTASVQAAEAIKVLLKKEDTLSGKLLTIDLLSQEYETFKI
jgi:molybdopterin/thiamine biosynthesis adenylyltransferase